MQISPEVLQQVREVPHFKDSQYKDLDIAQAIDYYRRKFVEHCPLEAGTVADLGCGYGFLAIAFAAHSNLKVIAVDMDPPRLEAARRIAEVLGLGDRIDFRVGALGSSPLADQEADAVYCIEVLEHVYRNVEAFDDLRRTAKRYIVFTTPNGAFPVIQHDTGLPFCHWLPMGLRNVYAKICGRSRQQAGNLFWTPVDVRRHLKGFRLKSKFMHYDNVGQYFELYPYYLPYGRGKWKRRPSKLLSIYLRTAAIFGRNSDFFMHSIAGVYERV